VLPLDLEVCDRPHTIVHSRALVRSTGDYRELIAIRTSDYKYIWNWGGCDELYHLKQDPDETLNLIDQRPDKANELRAHVRGWLSLSLFFAPSQSNRKQS
jgi:arylsulfatase A-like enzyme